MLTSSGLVAFGIVSLLPVELILQVGSSAGFAMVFSMLISAIVWNLGTWWLGLPASSSHTLIGSIIGVGVVNALMHGRSGTSGVDWDQATKIGEALLVSPLVGFFLSAALLLVMKFAVRKPALYSEPKPGEKTPIWIRGLLILTCTGVSFAHGSNDGQKGMGLIMLILIGTVPTAYALNRALPESEVQSFIQVSSETSKVVDGKAAGYNIIGDPRAIVTKYVSSHEITGGTYPALAKLIDDVAHQVQSYGSIAKIPATAAGNTRNDMYLTSEAVRILSKDKASELTAADKEDARLIQERARPFDQVHSDLGEDGCRPGAWPRHDDRLEAHRRHRRREDRQDAFDLWSGCLGRAGRDGHDHGGGCLRPACLDDPRPVVGRRRDDGGERLGHPVVDAAVDRDGMGAHAPLRHGDLGNPVLHLLEDLLTSEPSSERLLRNPPVMNRRVSSFSLINRSSSRSRR